MEAEATRQLIDRVLAILSGGAPEYAGDPLEVSGSVFTDPELLAREKAALFDAKPQVVGFSCQLPEAGSSWRFEFMGVPVILTRAEDGILRAFLNACRHRGAQLENKKPNRLSCPFHGWQYDLNGDLAGRREESAFCSDANTSLVRLPVLETAGLIVLAPGEVAGDGTPENLLDDFYPHLRNFAFERMHHLETRRLAVRANWKLVASLSHEAYHFANLHRDSVANMLLDVFAVDFFGKHSRWAFPLKGIEEFASGEKRESVEYFPGAVNHTFYPGATVLVTNPNDAQMIRVEPGNTPGESVVIFTGVYRDSNDIAGSRELFEFGLRVFGEEDLPAAAACQRGLEGGLPNVVIGRNEPVVQHWHRTWSAAVDK